MLAKRHRPRCGIVAKRIGKTDVEVPVGWLKLSPPPYYLMHIKAVIAGRGNLVANQAISPHPTDIGQEHARLAGHIGPHIPAIGFRE